MCSLMSEPFECIAGKCKHNCCIGWEIDIDEETYDKYQTVEGDFGVRLRNGIGFSEEGEPYFKLDDDERCVFLNDNNLCDIILNLGDDYLCDICREHPRFYVEDSEGNYVKGYGLCCEEAARLMLYGSRPSDDFIVECCQDCLSLPDFDNAEKIIEFGCFLCSLEQLGDRWSEWIKDLSAAVLEHKNDIAADEEGMEKQLGPAQLNAMYHLMEYLIFRYDDIGYARVMWQYILLLYLSMRGDNEAENREVLTEICRVYSSEIEYSDVNVDEIKESLRLPSRDRTA